MATTKSWAAVLSSALPCRLCARRWPAQAQRPYCIVFRAPQEKTIQGYGDLTFDKAGNIYGTTTEGGDQGACFEDIPDCGVVSNWPTREATEAENVIHTFAARQTAFTHLAASYSTVPAIFMVRPRWEATAGDSYLRGLFTAWLPRTGQKAFFTIFRAMRRKAMIP